MGTIGFGQSPWMRGGGSCIGSPNMGALMSQMMMQSMMRMLMQLMAQCCSHSAGGGFSPGMSPGFGGGGGGFGGGCGGGGFGGGRGPSFNPCSGFLGGHYDHHRQAGGGSEAGQPFSPPPVSQGGSSASGDASVRPGGVPLSQRSIDLIKRSEGFDQPGKWPGASSGITIGVGYDLGYVTREQFRKDWGDRLPPDQMARLERCIGIKGKAARNLSSQFRDIRIPKDQAGQVFETATLPKFYNEARKAFPGMENLSPDVQGALTSVVFNRGAAMKGDRRREMRQIRAAVGSYQPGSDPTRTQNQIAASLRGMKRLWVGQGVDGLLTRRDNEARLVQNAVPAFHGMDNGMRLAMR